jgi:fido (protein-threonine AMPylation protein)
MSTETDLRDWRGGSIGAERLAAALLTIEGFTDIVPQAPLGGGDGRKDILARRDGLLWVVAVYFPPTPQKYSEVTKKFKDDLAGVAMNQADAFAFFVNQPLTLDERAELVALPQHPVEVYFLERVRAILDSPRGYGTRLEYLRIKMEIEEQVAFFSELHADISQKWLANEAHQREMMAKLDQILGQSDLNAKVDEILERTRYLGALLTERSSLVSGQSFLKAVNSPTSALDIPNLVLIHHIVTEGDASETAHGRLRSIDVWIGDREKPSFVPAPASEVAERLTLLTGWWREIYDELDGASTEDVIDALARLHHGIASIHPFVDGNGRVARAVTDQAARELLGRRVGMDLIKPPDRYFATLQAADDGDIEPLKRLIRAALL